jgi:hypothetical protein
MTTMHAHGISAGLPSGFEGRIFKRSGNGIEVTNAEAQFATTRWGISGAGPCS